MSLNILLWTCKINVFVSPARLNLEKLITLTAKINIPQKDTNVMRHAFAYMLRA
jgi:hypothetical protein